MCFTNVLGVCQDSQVDKINHDGFSSISIAKDVCLIRKIHLAQHFGDVKAGALEYVIVCMTDATRVEIYGRWRGHLARQQA